MHEIEVAHFTVNGTLITFYSNHTISQNTQDEVPALVVLYAIELQPLSGDVDVLHIHFGCEDEGIANELPLDNVAINRNCSQDFQLVVDEDCFLQADHTPDLSFTSPYDIDHDVCVIQT